MKRVMRRARRGFSLVELLAVVLILAVLAAVAVPLYLNTRKTSAARACKANLAAIAAAESARALRDGVYVELADLVGSGPEALANEPKCPLDNTTAYTINPAPNADPTVGTKALITIACPRTADHQGDMGIAPRDDWSRTMAAIGGEALIP